MQVSKPRKRLRIYRLWCDMKSRCNNPNNTSYPNYGAKGTKVCIEWNESFDAFKDWALANGYDDSLTIDRIDGSQGYKPSNCRWVSRATQARNRGAFSTSTSKFAGVSWNSQYKMWTAIVCFNRKNKWLGRFPTEIEAAHARDAYLRSNNLHEYQLNF